MRPFRIAVDGEQIAGEIAYDEFVLRAYATEVVLTGASLGEDERGRYADVSEGDIDIGPGFRVHCEIEPDESLSVGGGQIAFEFGTSIRERTERRARTAGYHPERFNIIGPRADRSVSVYFDPDGQIDGSGSHAPADPARPN